MTRLVIPSAAANPGGLHGRYKTEHVDGRPIDPRATYFVLRLDSFGDDELHAEACRFAAKGYAQYIFARAPNSLEQVAKDLMEIVRDIERIVRASEG